MTQQYVPTGSAPCNEATTVTTTDGTLPSSDAAGGGLSVADDQGSHAGETWSIALHTSDAGGGSATHTERDLCSAVEY